MRRRIGVGSVIVLLVAASTRVVAAERPLLASGCSISNVGYLADLAADYERITGTKVFVRGGGSVVGLEDLAAGKVDFAAACRERVPADPRDVEFVQVAWDALVFIVHPSNPLDTISLGGAAAVFEGVSTDWSRIGGPAGPIQVFIQRPATGLSGVESSVRNQLLKGQAPRGGHNSSDLASSGIVEQLVERTPAGFGASGFSSARKRAVKMLALDGVQPTKVSIVDRTYPLRRPLYLIVKTPASPNVRAFLDFVLGPKGQELIGSYGVVSLRDLR